MSQELDLPVMAALGAGSCIRRIKKCRYVINIIDVGNKHNTDMFT